MHRRSNSIRFILTGRTSRGGFCASDLVFHLFLCLSLTPCLSLRAEEAGASGRSTSYISTEEVKGGFPLSSSGKPSPLCASSNDYAGVLLVLQMFQSDIQRVTGALPRITLDSLPSSGDVVIIGTIGKSPLIDGLIREKKIDAAEITGKWEAFLIQPVAGPLPGVRCALVIAGSDKRGTIYGMLDISRRIGVSPWHWWADVPVRRRGNLIVVPGRHTDGPPSVKYRGIFLNDEYPDLTRWVTATYGTAPVSNNPPVPPGIAMYGHEFYGRVFELLLRLKANSLWPAMWNNAFNEDDPENARLADEMGIVMGTSHQEPMMRAQKEWDRRYLKTLGTWNYAKNPDLLQSFWREGIRRNRNMENIVTIGLRGANDTPMAPGGPEANRALLEEIVGVQRKILAEEVNPDLTRVPQVWCLYKEVLDYYNAGMRVPDDVTLLWPDDNWGNVRRLPTPEERARSGGAGIYYHFDYHGGPRSYQWINANPIAKIWDQMSLAKQYGADRIWIVNVGHLKGYEFPLEYFMALAWNAEKWTSDNTGEFTRLWAEREFGPERAPLIADIISRYSRYNGRRKPELLSPATYSLTDYNEAGTVVAEYREAAAAADSLYATLPADERDAFYELVLFPAKAGAIVNELYNAAGKNALYASQGRSSTNEMAAETRRLFTADTALMGEFNHSLAGGKWGHFMDQPHLGYTGWQDPPENNLGAIPLAEIDVPVPARMGVAIDGSASFWPGSGASPVLPPIDSFNHERSSIEIFNRGKTPFEFDARADLPWITLSAQKGEVHAQTSIAVTIDWSRKPAGDASGTVKIRGTGSGVDVRVNVVDPAGIDRSTLRGFMESDGVVSIEPEHFTANAAVGSARWIRIEGYGHTLSGMRGTAPADAPPALPGSNSPSLEYRMYLLDSGRVDVDAIFGPALNFVPGRGLRYAVSFDDETPAVVTLVGAGYSAGDRNGDWARCVEDNARHSHSAHGIAHPGYHTLHVWMVDPGVVIEKIVVDCGGLRPSYMGPPESYHRIPENASELDRSRLMDILGLTLPSSLPSPALDPRRPAFTFQRKGSNNWYDSTGNFYVRSEWGSWSNYDESNAGAYALPDPLLLNDGSPVTNAATWWKKRRPEILREYRENIFGKEPDGIPSVKFTVTGTDSNWREGKAVRKEITGTIDNSAFPACHPRVSLTLYLPPHPRAPVPLVVMVSGGFPPLPTRPGNEPEPRDQVLARGWAYAVVDTRGIQEDNGAELETGIIGLVNKGKGRSPGQWGVLAAWSWGLSRAMDYLQSCSGIDPKKIALQGHSRWGKTALLAAALDGRWSLVFSSCSGAMGASLERRNWGETIDNVAWSGEYHWMAGNFLRYAGNWQSMPVDAHELIALIAPRPVFITGGTLDQWSDPHGEFLACLAASPVYRLLGVKGMNTSVMPLPDAASLGGTIGFREHAGGHSDRPDWPAFLEFADRYFAHGGKSAHIQDTGAVHGQH